MFDGLVVQHEIVVREGEDTRIPCELQPGSQDRVNTFKYNTIIFLPFLM